MLPCCRLPVPCLDLPALRSMLFALSYPLFAIRYVLFALSKEQEFRWPAGWLFPLPASEMGL